MIVPDSANVVKENSAGLNQISNKPVPRSHEQSHGVIHQLSLPGIWFKVKA